MNTNNGATIGENIPSILKGRDALRLRHAQHQQELLERQARHNEELRENHNRRHFLGEWREGDDKGEEMGDINVDSPTTHNHYHNTGPGDERPPAPARKRLGRLAKIAIGGALLATGASIPIGGKLILDAIASKLRPETPPAPTVIVEPHEHEDTSGSRERKYSLDLGDPED